MKNKKNKIFSIFFSFIFGLVGVWPLLNSEPLRLWSIIVSVVFFILAIFKPNSLNFLNILWIKFGDFLGKIIAPVIMAFIFFFILTPISFLLRLFGKDIFKTKFIKIESYWIRREKKMGSMKRQF